MCIEKIWVPLAMTILSNSQCSHINFLTDSMQTSVDLSYLCNLMARNFSSHCHRILARYVAVCNIVADYCLTNSSHSLGSHAEKKCRPKYTEIYYGHWITNGQNISQNILVTRVGYDGIFHTYLLVAKFIGERVLKYFYAWPENGTPFDPSDLLPGYWAILYIVLTKASTVQTCRWCYCWCRGYISFRSCCFNCNTIVWLQSRLSKYKHCKYGTYWLTWVFSPKRNNTLSDKSQIWYGQVNSQCIIQWLNPDTAML